MKTNAVRWIAAAAACCLLAGTGVFAAGRIASVRSQIDRQESTGEIEDIGALAGEAGFSILYREAFANGFVFREGGLSRESGEDADGKPAASWNSIWLSYEDDRGRSLSVSAEEAMHVPQDLEAQALEARTAGNTRILYNCTTYHFVPADYEASEEELERRKTDPHYALTYGAEKESLQTCENVAFETDGIRYVFVTFDGLGMEELFAMAEELLAGE